MKSFKKILSVAIFLQSFAIFSSTVEDKCQFHNITIPCKEKTNWEFGSKALYFLPTTTSDTTSYIDIGNINSDAFAKSPNRGWGFMLEGAYNFNTNNNLNLNWYHVESKLQKNLNYTRTLSIPKNLSTSLIDTSDTEYSTITFNNTQDNISPRWDMVNLEIGQYINFNKINKIRLHTGLEYARVISNGSAFIIGNVTRSNNENASFAGTVTNKPSYNGFGPRFGMDMGMTSDKGIGLYANGAAGLLIGKAKYMTQITNKILNSNVIIRSSTNTIVPEIDGKIGIDYTHKLIKGNIIIDGGWMWVNYFNSMRSQGSTDLNTTPNSDDFGLNGLYFGFKWISPN